MYYISLRNNKDESRIKFSECKELKQVLETQKLNLNTVVINIPSHRGLLEALNHYVSNGRDI